MTIQEKIIAELIKHPGARKRGIAHSVQSTVIEIIPILHEMCDEGILRYEVYRDCAQMEFYEKYYVVDRK